jgi:putative PIN family toxin of toxin-antitoxin system
VKPAVVFDTSILLSAIGWNGKPAACLELARTARIQGVTCTEILNELADKLHLKLGFSDRQVIEVIGSLQLFLNPVEISGEMTGLCADPKDDMVLECGLVAKATHVVSSDKKHLLCLKEFRGIQIVSASQLLELVNPPATS